MNEKFSSTTGSKTYQPIQEEVEYELEYEEKKDFNTNIITNSL